jgi:hypothetical protein
MRSRLRAFAVVAALAGCGTTTVDSVDTTEPAPDPTATTVVPVGTPAELLGRLQLELTTLSEKVVEDEGEEDALRRVDELWAATEPAVTAARPDLLEQFQAVIDYAHRAVERRRPADADKATNNLRVLIDAFTA